MSRVEELPTRGEALQASLSSRRSYTKGLDDFLARTVNMTFRPWAHSHGGCVEHEELSV